IFNFHRQHDLDFGGHGVLCCCSWIQQFRLLLEIDVKGQCHLQPAYAYRLREVAWQSNSEVAVCLFFSPQFSWSRKLEMINYENVAGISAGSPFLRELVVLAEPECFSAGERKKYIEEGFSPDLKLEKHELPLDGTSLVRLTVAR